ncbi:MAG TPA: oxygenase MpaB family protein [Microbacteriaceae bacterium]|nr:oxygenase MpaB family protein [Microbacteriaceae bacterium]
MGIRPTTSTTAREPITIASTLAAKREDDGYFGPESVTWKVMSHPAALNIGGGVAVLLQVLEPGEMRHLAHTTIAAESSDAAEQRFQRTAAYLITVNFGDQAHADAAAAHVDRLHEHSVHTDERTGETSRAKTDDWLRWTHNTFVWGALTSVMAYGLELTPEEQDRFVLEQHRAAALLHVPHPLPANRAELDEVIEGWGERAALTLDAADIAFSLRNPAADRNAIERWVARNTQYGLIALLPPWALRLYGLDGVEGRRVRSGRRWMGLFMRLAARNRTMDRLIADSTAQATAHPYKELRTRRPAPTAP